MSQLFFLLLGLFLLWLGAEFIVKSSQTLSEYFKISSLFFGLTIVSLGTSLPEIAVSVSGGFQRLEGIETSDIALGNIIGSALNQITLLIGIIGVVSILYIEKKQVYRDGIMLILSILLLAIVSIDYKITFFDSVVLISAYLIYLGVLLREEKIREKLSIFVPKINILFEILRFIIGIVILYFSSKIVLTNAKEIAHMFKIAESTIGILVIGLGTGIPELTVSLAAVRKKAIGLSVGNLIGSNITDLLFSLGIGTIIAELSVKRSLLLYDIPFLFIVTLITIIFMRTKEKFERKEAYVLIAFFIVYTGLKFTVKF